MIYSSNIKRSNSNSIMSECAEILKEAKFTPSESVPNSLRSSVKDFTDSILKKAKKMDTDDKKIAKAIKSLEDSKALAANKDYTDNAFPVQINKSIAGGVTCIEYAVSNLKSIGFKHSKMEDSKKGQTWYKISGKDIIVATVIGVIIGNSIATVIFHAVQNNEHNKNIINNISESVSSECGKNNYTSKGFEGLTPEQLYGFNPELGLTRSEELSGQPEYSEFFRDPKIMAAFTEHLDLTDSLTRKAVRCMNEADQHSVLTSLTSKLYDNIVSKVDDIDYGDIPMSKGDITQIPNWFKLRQCVDLLKDILVGFKQDTTPIDTIALALANVETRKDLFTRAFKMDAELPIIMYNNVVLTIIDAVSYMIATSIEFMKTPNRDSFQITLDKVAFAKTKSNMLYNNLKKFNKSCESKDFDKAMEHILQNRIKKLSEGAVASVATSLAIAGAAILLILNIIPILREMVFFFYYTRMRVSDFFDIQADLLQMNAYNVENDTSKSDEQKERIISKQLKIVEFFRKMANKISINSKKAEIETTKEITSANKKMKLSDVTNELPDSVSALF